MKDKRGSIKPREQDWQKIYMKKIVKEQKPKDKRQYDQLKILKKQTRLDLGELQTMRIPPSNGDQTLVKQNKREWKDFNKRFKKKSFNRNPQQELNRIKL
ncbi:unnamed protein product [Paramecium sonneborni]|uniref:Uncharacterized protein n=1 Tax=Paramecium sonneborni TaxID=65129 RepID=A0A8S1RNJ8_9CILI|nr:unnamed protein product [Paramecium sonneborni]